MDEIAALRDLELYEQLIPTSKICSALISPRGSLIRTTKRETFSYGPHERHDLDLYTPSADTPNPASSGNRPLLVFVYGGGFASGDKIFDLIPGGLVYPNLGSFVAEELGYDVAIINYRLTKHGAKFPRGAEDLDLALKWLNDHYAGQGKKSLYILGNSAGGIHLTTWLFWPEYREARKWFVAGTTSTLNLKAAVTLGCPFIWPKLVINSQVGESVKGYYGDEQSVESNAALILVQKALANEPKGEEWPPILTLVSEMDPQDIRESGKSFVQLWTSAGHKADYRVLEGHNHFTTVWALRSGVHGFEKWAYDLGEWLKAVD